MNKEYETRTFFWLADKCFALHSVLTIIIAVLFALAGIWGGVGGLIALWLLTAAIWQEWKNS
jgi:hypothetical protein